MPPFEMKMTSIDDVKFVRFETNETDNDGGLWLLLKQRGERFIPEEILNGRFSLIWTHGNCRERQ